MSAPASDTVAPASDTVAPADSAWRPQASLATLRERARMFATVRQFFAARAVLEVDTPQLVNHAVSDVHLHSAEVSWPTPTYATGRTGAPLFLHTSAEYAMKRLLAAGSGDLYQLCHVFRGEESGPLHNSEFMMLEWYRVGWSLEQLMREVDEILRALLGAQVGAAAQYLSYEQAFVQSLGCNPLTDSDEALSACALALGFDAPLVARCGRDELLDLMIGAHIGPRLGMDGPVFVHRYPASQAALARLDPVDARVALRFEVYRGGIELANGFEELGAAREQRARFMSDQRQRATRSLAVNPLDEFLLAALAAGLPDCSGVAVGIDRVLMLATGAARLDEVMAFTTPRA